MYQIVKDTVGVYAVSALSIAYLHRLGAEYLIGRGNSYSSELVGRSKAILVNGRRRDLRAVWRRCLADEHDLPELVLVCCNVDQLDAFLDELMELFVLVDRSGRCELRDIPYFLTCSSGIYIDDLLTRATHKVSCTELADTTFFLDAVPRRLMRGVSYQAAFRHGWGSRADYRFSDEHSFLLLSQTGRQEDRDRVSAVLARRGYEAGTEKRPGQAELDKALANLILSAFCQLYAVRDGRLIDVRLGDLLGRHPLLPPSFQPARLRHSSHEISRRQEVLGRAIMAIGRSTGVYSADDTLEARLESIRSYIARHIWWHLPSSFQHFRDHLSRTPGDWSSKSLLPTERAIIHPIMELASGRTDLTAEVDCFKLFEQELIRAYHEAFSLREDESTLSACAFSPPISRLERAALEFRIEEDVIRPFGDAFNLGPEDAERLVDRFVKAAGRLGEDRQVSHLFLLETIMPLADLLVRLHSEKTGEALVVGIDGHPGVGKTTFADSLRLALQALGEKDFRSDALVLSLDDFYYSKAEMEELRIPTWGPGAHDLGFARLLARLKQSTRDERLELPRYDKQLRDRRPAYENVAGGINYIVFEGFGVGLQSHGYHRLSRQIDLLVVLDAGEDLCRRWRRHAASDLSDPAFNGDFDRTWQIIVSQASWVMPDVVSRADLVLVLGEDHSIRKARRLTWLT